MINRFKFKRDRVFVFFVLSFMMTLLVMNFVAGGDYGEKIAKFEDILSEINDLETIQEPAEEDKVFVVYQYVERDDVPEVKTESRPFCVRMMLLALTRRYTLSQLKNLRNGEGDTGIDIFTKRGGWYHNPVTDKTTPYCRHTWKQQLVRLKK